MTAQSNPPATRDLRLAARTELRTSVEDSRLAGFGNILSKELGEWFATRRWLWQLLIWLAIINGFIAFLLYVVPKIDPSEASAAGNPPPDVMGLTMYFSLAVVAGAIGVIIMAQDEVIHEKQSGTAAWTLSKPVSRKAFILAKVLSNIIGAFIFIVALTGLVTLAEVFLAVQRLPPVLPFLAGAGVVLLTLIFYICLVICLGVFFEQRGPVLAVAFGLMFGGLIASQFAPQIAYILPLNMDKIALAVSQGQALPAMGVSEVITAAVWSILFVVAALIGFERIEF